MRTIAVLVAKDLRRRLRNPLGTVIMIAFPVVFALLLGATFGGGGGENLPPIEVLLVDEDASLTGTLIRGAFGQEQMASRFSLREIGREEGEELISQGRASALLLVPRGFTDNLLEGRPDTLRLWRNPRESIMPMVAEELTEVIALVLDSASRIFGEPLAAIHQFTGGGGFPADEDVSAVSVAINQTFRDLQRYIDPVIIDINTAEREPETEAISEPSVMVVALFVLPGMAVFSLLLVGQMTMRDILREQAAGTLRRLVAAPLSIHTVVVSKAVSSVIVGLGCLLVLTMMGALFHAPKVDPLGYLLISLAFLVAASGFAAVAYGGARNENQGGTIGHIIIMIMAFVGGSWMPLDMLPAFVRRLAPFTLNYWAIDGYKQLLFAEAGLGDLGVNLLVLGAAGIIMLSLGGITLRYKLMRGM